MRWANFKDWVPCGVLHFCGSFFVSSICTRTHSNCIVRLLRLDACSHDSGERVCIRNAASEAGSCAELARYIHFLRCHPSTWKDNMHRET
jgi:hypothetical protein